MKGYGDPDPREKSLPKWARRLLANYRRALDEALDELVQLRGEL